MPVIELLSLAVVALLNSVLWVPSVLGYVRTRGFLQPKDYVSAPDTPLPNWVNRAVRAHANAVENLSPFAATALIAAALQFTTGLTQVLAATFAATRILHAVVHISGFSKAMARTVVFGIANTASVIYTILVVINLAGRLGK